MPQLKNRQFLDFEKPIKDLYDQIEQLKSAQEKTKTDMSGAIAALEQRIVETKKNITDTLTPWHRVQLSRHPDRPYTLKYIEKMCTDFVELHGDRNVRDDKAMVGGFAKLGEKTVMIIGTSTYLLGLIAVADALRKNSPASVAELKRSGIRHTILLTGDNAATAAAVAAAVGVDEFRAELLPQDKLAAIHELRGQYGKVAMVGDGINDAPALALSTVGIAMGGAGADTALETADVALMADDLGKLPFLIRLSRQTLTIIRQNIAFSLAVKALAILAVFPGWLTLWLAILADMGATLLVTLNSLRLLMIKDKP